MLLLSLALLVSAVTVWIEVPALFIHWTYPWPVYALLFAAVATAVASKRRGVRRYATIAVTGLVASLFIAYTAGFSRLNRPQLAVQPGDAFVDFTLQTSTKETFSPAQLRGKTAALYVLYRGDW